MAAHIYDSSGVDAATDGMGNVKITASPSAAVAQPRRTIDLTFDLESDSTPPMQNDDLVVLQSPHRTIAGDARDSFNSMKVSVWKRVLFLFLAACFFALAAAGVILPGPPTTPFLMLTSYFLVRSYPTLNEKLLKSALFGPILVDWQVKRGVRRDVKAKAVSVVMVAVGFSIYITAFALGPSLIFAVFASIGIVVIVILPEPRD